MGTAIALRERSNAVPQTPTDRVVLIKELRKITTNLDVERRLQAYGAALRTLEDPSVSDARYFLLMLNPAEGYVNIQGFDRHELEYASQEYLKVERTLPSSAGAEAVLVSVESLAALKRAYPNYFLDTRAFLQAVRRAIVSSMAR
jgi:hypothetical protein